MLFSEFHKTMVNNVIFAGFRGAFIPAPGSAITDDAAIVLL